MRRGVATSAMAGIALGLILAGWLLVQANPGPAEGDAPLLEGPADTDAALSPPLDPDQRAVVADPEGDAVGSGGAGGDPATDPACDAAQPLCEAPPSAPAGAPGADPPGTPPSQDVDIVEAGYEGETGDSLRFFLSLARLDASWPALTADGAADLALQFSLCWAAHDGQPCDRTLRLDAWLHADKPATQATFELSSPACGPRGLCAWPVAAHLEPGAPGTIRFSLPKALATADGAWPRVAALSATAAWTGHAGAGMLGPFGWDLQLGTVLRSNNQDPGAVHRVADTTVAHGETIRFAGMAAGGATVVSSRGLVGTRPGPGHDSDHPALDLRGLTAEVRENRLHLDLRLGSAQQWPNQAIEHWIDLDSATASWRIVHRHDPQRAEVLLVPCSTTCDRGRATALSFSYVEGSVVRTDVPLAALGLGPGEFTHRLQATSLLVAAEDVRQDGAAAQAHEWFDALPPAPPLVLA